jgi:hypothetical protein
VPVETEVVINHALILQASGRLEEALALYKKEEALGLQLSNLEQFGLLLLELGLLAREQRDRKVEREKLAAALDIFMKLKHAPRAPRLFACIRCT